jgi:hypothetical protein
LVVNAGYLLEETPHWQTPQWWQQRGLASTLAGVAARVPVPLPANYVRGASDARDVMANESRVTFRGRQYESGVWYWYLYGLLVKLPLGTLALGAVALWRLPQGVNNIRDAACLMLPAATIAGVVTWLSGLSDFFRYILPLFPFLFLVLASAAAALRNSSALAGWLAVGLVCASAASSLVNFPHSMAYYNELAGGIRGGPRHMLDRSSLWGQDLYRLRRWLDRNPDIECIQLTDSGAGVDPQAIGIRHRLPRSSPPTGAWVDRASSVQSYGEFGPSPGWHAVAVADVAGSAPAIEPARWAASNPLVYFQLFEPADFIGGSIWMYFLSEQDVRRVRRDYGWSEIEAAD